MRRIDRQELQTTVYVAIKTAPALATRALRSKLPHESDEGARALAERICNLIDNKSHMVIAAEMVGTPHERTPGVFGVTEPDPCP